MEEQPRPVSELGLGRCPPGGVNRTGRDDTLVLIREDGEQQDHS